MFFSKLPFFTIAKLMPSLLMLYCRSDLEDDGYWAGTDGFEAGGIRIRAC